MRFKKIAHDFDQEICVTKHFYIAISAAFPAKEILKWLILNFTVISKTSFSQCNRQTKFLNKFLQVNFITTEKFGNKEVTYDKKLFSTLFGTFQAKNLSCHFLVCCICW